MAIHRGMDKEDVVHTYNGLLLHHTKEWNCAICRDIGGSNMVIQNEVSQKEKNKHHILIYICRI